MKHFFQSTRTRHAESTVLRRRRVKKLRAFIREILLRRDRCCGGNLRGRKDTRPREHPISWEKNVVCPAVCFNRTETTREFPAAAIVNTFYGIFTVSPQRLYGFLRCTL